MSSIRRVFHPAIALLLLCATTSADTLEGTVERRVAGVKHWLSCHCVNGLLVRTGPGTIEPVCLPKNKGLSCESVKFTGAYREHTNDPAPTNPCPIRTQRIFFVDSAQCLKVDSDAIPLPLSAVDGFSTGD